MRTYSKRTWLALALSAHLGALPGCGTLLFHDPEKVLVTSNAPGALVEARGEGQACRAPGQLSLSRSADHVLTVTAEGYEPRTVRVDSSFSWWRILVSLAANATHGVFTLFISTAIGCFVDLSTGAWQTLDPDELQVDLVRRYTSFQEEWPQADEAVGRSRYCTGCGARLAGVANFCAVCGERQAPAAPPAPRLPVPSEGAPALDGRANAGHCARCGAPAEGPERFCGVCGTKR